MDNKQYWTRFRDSAYIISQQHIKDNSLANALSSALANECTTIGKEIWEKAIESIRNEIYDENDSHARALDKKAVINKIPSRINAGGLTKDQELKYIAELNKLQDNYSKEIDSEWVVELVQYLCPVCDADKVKTSKPTQTKFH